MSKYSESRRNFLKASALGACLLGTQALKIKKSHAKEKDNNLKKSVSSKKVMILGIDGMDPNLLKQFADEGLMPTFKELMKEGYFSSLGTTIPPQSPVAWASFITGMHPGKHGIFDFVHRDPKTFEPFLSTSKSEDSTSTLNLGKWKIPLKSGKVELLRQGTPFWKYLHDNHIFSSIFKIPANFPVVDKDTQAISGMGTPDLLGSYGTFTVFAEKEPKLISELSGGRIVKLSSPTYTFKTKIEGPVNSFLNEEEVKYASVDFTIDKDPENKIVRIRLQDKDYVLQEGEWSPWISVNFELFPLIGNVKGIVRFFVQKVQPDLQVYMTPINVDPIDPTLPLCYPKDYSKKVANDVGMFYTQGFPEDTKALSTGIFSYDEFFTQGKKVLKENLRLFDRELKNFNDGVFFFYFTSIDQNSHMLLHLMDPKHVLYQKNISDKLKNSMRYYYSEMDKMLKKALTKVDDDTTLIIMSDHGFAPFYREFNLSTWLVKNGFTAVTDKDKFYESESYDYVDWSKTKAYALGINCIYLNLKSREKNGCLTDEEGEKVKKELIAKLEKEIDPKTGFHPVTKAYDTNEAYANKFPEIRPDIVVGYNRGYRISDGACLGKFPKDIFADRTNKWAADHCMDPSHVPGILITNKKIQKKNPHIVDLAPSILALYGISTPEDMDGKDIFMA